MSKTFVYLVYFGVYSLAILFIGKSSFGESDSISKFFVGERKIGLCRLFFTCVGTWISAATILGYTGNVYQNGVAVISMSVIPWFIGALMLYAISNRLYDNDILTIPQLIRNRYGSRGLQIASALLMSCGYVLYLVMQIKGFGIAASNLLNIDYKVAVFLVYLFILYSTFGGFNSVIKTDTCNLVMLALSVGVIYFVIVGKVEGTWLLSDSTVARETLKAGVAVENPGLFRDYSPLMYISMFFGWGMGLATNPQYMIRIVAAKDKKTARKMLLCAIVFLALFYFALTQIGLGLKILFPRLDTFHDTDDIFVYAVNYLLQSRFSGFFLISVIGACLSTANSQLLLIGSMLSYDVAGQFGKNGMKEDKLLGRAKWFIFIGGTLALILSLNPPEDILFFGADIWGVFAVIFTPLIYGALLYPRGTKAGAYGSFIVGIICAALLWGRTTRVYWAFPATACSVLAYLVIPFFQRKTGAKG